MNSLDLQHLLSTGADITLVVDEAGAIRDIAYGNSELEAFGLDKWIGKPFRAVVTQECGEKVDSMIADLERDDLSRPYQVNHPGPNRPDLPVSYVAARVTNKPLRLVFGTDLRHFSTIQQQLIQSQFELEREYRRLREVETRYRIAFHKLNLPVVIVEGEDLRIADANAAAAAHFRIPASKIVGELVVSLFNREDRDRIASFLREARVTGASGHLSVQAATNGSSLVANVDPYREDGRINFVISFPGTMAGHGAKGFSADTEIAAWIENVPQPMVVADGRGMIRSANEKFLDITQAMNRAKMTGRHLNNWLGASPVDMQVLLGRLQEEDEVVNFLSVARDELGTTTPVRLSARKFAGHGGEGIAIIVSEAPKRDTHVSVSPHGVSHGATGFSELVGRVPLKELIREASDVIEKMCIEAALRQSKDNRASAADMLGLSRQSLYIKLKRHDLEDFSVDS